MTKLYLTLISCEKKRAKKQTQLLALDNIDQANISTNCIKIKTIVSMVYTTSVQSLKV